MTGVLIRRPCEERVTDIQRKIPREDGGRDLSDAFASQGMPRIAGNH